MKHKYFKRYEFTCKCCGHEEMHDEHIARLDDARFFAGIPFHVNSGWRCERHNEKVGGSENSSHRVGYASDIKCTDSSSRNKIIKSLLKAGFTRIGIAKDFIHVDNDPNKAQNVIWTY